MPILSVRVVEKDACCLSVVYAVKVDWQLTEGENGQAKPLLYRNFLFEQSRSQQLASHLQLSD